MNASFSDQHPQIIGLTGSFGSGCSYIANEIIVPYGYQKLSLSDELKALYQKEYGREHSCRNDLQQFGDYIRQRFGPDFLAQKVISQINEEASEQTKWVIDSIRNPAEIQAFRNHSSNFYLFGLYADKDKRWDRVNQIYHDVHKTFLADDQNDTGANNESFGQRVSDCFYEADVVLANNEDFASTGNAKFRDLEKRVQLYISLVESPLSRKQTLRPEEAMMVMAYTISQRSSCLQRKVGAVITDQAGTVISSGFNEVPQGETPCFDEHGQCYRKRLIEEFSEKLSEIVPTQQKEVMQCFKQHFRVLDKCRALHAEENAIVSLARQGRASTLNDCTLYTTTYPCRLCASKISQLGIKRVVYLEPYPDEEAKLILASSGVQADFFEGITYRAYFRIYGEKK